MALPLQGPLLPTNQRTQPLDSRMYPLPTISPSQECMGLMFFKTQFQHTVNLIKDTWLCIKQRARRSYSVRRGCRTSHRHNGLHCAASSAEACRPSEQSPFFFLYIKKVFPFVSYDCQKLEKKSCTLEISSMRRD